MSSKWLIHVRCYETFKLWVKATKHVDRVGNTSAPFCDSLKFYDYRKTQRSSLKLVEYQMLLISAM